MSEIFNFPYHTPQDEYPGGTVVKFGRGYSFAARPSGPAEIVCHLHFETMFVFQSQAGQTADAFVDHPLNVFLLEEFYKRHLLHDSFIYPHHLRGQAYARFNKPLVMPKTLKTSPGEVGGLQLSDGRMFRLHQVEAFDLEIILSPPAMSAP